MSAEVSKRTRSQLVVPDHVLRLPLTRSPLKHARVTSKNQMLVESNDQTKDREDLEVQDEEHKDDEILSPLKKNKRSSNAWPEDALSPTSYREPKRAKLEPLPALNLLAMVDSRNLTSQSSKRLTKPFVRAATEPACQKLTPRSVIMNGKATMASVFSQRARSVPLPTDPFPELDLRTLSPTRSPSKVTSQLRITPVPQLTEAAPTSPLTPPASTDGEVPASEDGMDVDTASAMSHFTNVPLIDPTLPDSTKPIINIEFATPRNQAGPPQTPLSPLTPLTPLIPTSFAGRLPAVQSLLAADADKKAYQPQGAVADASLLSGHAAGSSTSSAAPSRLPRLSTSTVSLMPPPPVPVKRGRSATIGSSHVARTKPIANLSKGKKVMHLPPGSRRVTRSVSMKGKEPEGLDESDESPETAGNTMVGTGKELEASSQTLTFKVPSFDTSSLKGLPDAAKLRQTSLASFMKAKPVPSSSMTDPPSSTATFVQRPPPSPSKIPLPVSPMKQLAGTSSAKKPIFGRSSTIAPTKHTSSLSTLSTALEKLARLPPSRPNTSLGFNVNSDKDERTKAGPSMTKDDSAVAGSSGTFLRPTASSLKRHATITGSARVNVVGRMKDRSGALGRTATGIFGPGLAKPSMKASRKTSLPSVMASPVKGGGGGAFDGNLIANATTNLGEEDLELEQQSNVTPPPAMSGSKTSEDASNEASFVIEELVMSTDKGKEREEWDSRRASSALHALSQSLSVLPETPLKPVVIGTRTGLRSSSSTYHAVSGSSSKSAVDTKNKGKGKEGTDGAAPLRGVPSKSDAAASPVEGGSAGKKGALKVLKKCAIFVDVRTDDGDDAGSLFVDMLRGLGARILGRIGQSCTHIVYKNGSASTLARYRLLNDPKPVVVGIAWVVECVEQRSRVDEVKFKVDLELVNVSGTNKRRRSMLPKHMSSLANGVGPCYIPVDLSSDDNEGKRQPNDGDGSPAQDTDTSFRSAKDEDDLPPLERARRRRSILPGGQTRLV